MKNKKYIFIIISLFLFFVTEVKAEILNYTDTIDYSNKIENNVSKIVSYENGYLILSTSSSSTIIYNYDNNHNFLYSKEITNLTNSSMIKYNDNYILVGISSNSLKTYLLDRNLQVTNQQETSYILDNSSILNLYNYNNKVYIMLTEESTLANNNIYEIDESLNIIENKFSSYDASILKEILKSDYYLIKNNDVTKDDKLIRYNSSTYTEEYIILAGNISNTTIDPTLGYNELAYFTILDKEGKEQFSKELNDHTNIKKVLIIKDKIVFLTTNTLLIYDLESDETSSILLPLTYDNYNIQANDFFIVSDNLFITQTNNDIQKTNIISIYNFDCTITNEESTYGIITISENIAPYQKVSLKITANSGYEVDSITVKDTQGNVIDLSNNEFTMPENDVIVTANYKASVENPETVDTIVIISLLTFAIIILTIHIIRKFYWLK